VATIAPRHAARLRTRGAIQAHRLRSRLTPDPDPESVPKVGAVCALYAAAPVLAEVGERLVSTDELPGVQALEGQHPGPCRATGQVIAPSCGPTRTAADPVAHLR